VDVATLNEFIEWKDNRVTKVFMKALRNDREALKDMLLAGTDDDSGLRGRAAAIQAILEMSYEDMVEASYARSE
jgi:hypothetical protein